MLFLGRKRNWGPSSFSARRSRIPVLGCGVGTVSKISDFLIDSYQNWEKVAAGTLMRSRSEANERKRKSISAYFGRIREALY